MMGNVIAQFLHFLKLHALFYEYNIDFDLKW